MICHGEKFQKRKYARILQKLGYPVGLNNFKMVTQSAVYQLRRHVKYEDFLQLPGSTYEPEIYHGLEIRRGGVYFIIYRSSKVVITGIKSSSVLNDIVYPTILELEML